ncbi:hypothetical protein Tco_1136506 [Tanacetum coccineum]
MVEDVENENSNVSNSDEPVLLNTSLSDKVECSDPEVDIDEIDAFLAMEVSSNFEEGVENDDSEDEDNSTFLPEHESPNLDHQDNPSAPRPILIQRISLTGFPAQSVGSSNTDVLDLPCLLVLITGTSQSRQHVDTSLIHVESRKSPTAVLFDDDTGRISIRHYEY